MAESNSESETAICYLCRKRPATTKDHVPPRNLFPRPVPIGMRLHERRPACKPCNGRFSPFDEYLRLAVSAPVNRSLGGDVAWDRVKGRTLVKRRIARLIDRITSRQLAGLRLAPSGAPVTVCELHFEARPIRASLIKMVKGFLHEIDPCIDSRALSYEITQMDQFAFQRLLPTLRNLKRFEICGDVFECWFGLDVSQKPPAGLWYMRFYRAAAFLIKHHKREPRPRNAAGAKIR